MCYQLPEDSQPTPPESRLPRTAAIIPVFERRAFDFTNITPGIASPNTVDVVLAPSICVLDFFRVRLAVRVHSITVSNSTQSISLFAFGTMPTHEDPTVEFLDSAPFLRLDLDSNTSPPSLVTATATDPDAYLKVIIRASMGSSSGPLRATLSACLIVRGF